MKTAKAYIEDAFRDIQKISHAYSIRFWGTFSLVDEKLELRLRRRSPIDYYSTVSSR
jgi:hypothetical protein